MISTVGYVYESEKSDAVGYMKINPGGNTIAVALSWESKFEIFSFDNSTGMIAFLFEIPIGNQVYGCEFSSDGSKLSLSSQFNLFQVDMNAGTPENIINSLTEIHQFDKPIGASQLAVNGKIYITCDTSEFLSVIKYPNELPNNCGFEYNAVFLDGSLTSYGLPNFIQSYYIPPIFTSENVCFSDETVFIIEGVSGIDSVSWNFGDPETGNLNISNDLSPGHVFSRSGPFYVSLRVWHDGMAYLYSQNIIIVPIPEIELGNDTAFCNLVGYELNAGGEHLRYLWNNLSTDSILAVDTSGSYYVLVENIYTTCKNSDTVNIIFSDIPKIDLGNDTSFCEQTIYTLNAWNESCSYRWQDHSTNPFLDVSEPGTYYVNVKNQFGCTNSDTINLSLKYIPVFRFPSDTVLCDHTLLNLLFDFEETRYVWQDGSQNNSFLVEQPGEYILSTQNSCGSWTDSLLVSYEYCGDIYIPNILSPNGDDYNNVFIIKGIEDQSWSLYIYNRWGQEVMFFDRYDNSWTGRDQNGRLLSEGVYYYRLINTMHNQSFNGTVRLFK
jgi:gliding motility-associated-like protein